MGSSAAVSRDTFGATVSQIRPDRTALSCVPRVIQPWRTAPLGRTTSRHRVPTEPPPPVEAPGSRPPPFLFFKATAEYADDPPPRASSRPGHRRAYLRPPWLRRERACLTRPAPPGQERGKVGRVAVSSAEVAISDRSAIPNQALYSTIKFFYLDRTRTLTFRSFF